MSVQQKLACNVLQQFDIPSCKLSKGANRKEESYEAGPQESISLPKCTYLEKQAQVSHSNSVTETEIYVQ